jgi:hypothetical protein
MADISNLALAIGPAFGLFKEVYTWGVDRDRRKKEEAQQVEAALTPEDRKARTEGRLRDILMVLNVLGERLFHLGLVESTRLPFAREQVVKAFRIRDDAFRVMFEEKLEQSSQDAVTAAMFLCAECWPMHIYHGFGACVLNEWLWGHPTQPNNAEITSMDQCISLLKAGLGQEVLKRYPAGLSRMTPRLKKKLKDHLLLSDEKFSVLQGKADLCKKKGPPQPKNKSFKVTEMIWPWSTYSSEFSLQNKFTSDMTQLAQLVEWQQDPGRMIYAFTIGGFLDLQPGQLLDPLDDEITMSILWWLLGLNSTSFKLIWQAELDIAHWELPSTNKKLQWWNQNSTKVVYAIMDESRSKPSHKSVLPQMAAASPPLLAQSESPFSAPLLITGAEEASEVQYIPPSATLQPVSAPTTAMVGLAQGATNDLAGLEFASTPVSADVSSPLPLPTGTTSLSIGHLPVHTQLALLSPPEAPATSFPPPPTTQAAPTLLDSIETLPNAAVQYQPAQSQLETSTLPQATSSSLSPLLDPLVPASISFPSAPISQPLASPDHLSPVAFNLPVRPHTTSPAPSTTTGMSFAPPPTVASVPGAPRHSTLFSWAKNHLVPTKASTPIGAVAAVPSAIANTTLPSASGSGLYQSAGSSATPLASAHLAQLPPPPPPPPSLGQLQYATDIVHPYQAPATTPSASLWPTSPQPATYIPTPAPQNPASQASTMGLSPMFKTPSIAQNQYAPQAVYPPAIGAYHSQTAPAVLSPPVYNPSAPAPLIPISIGVAPAPVATPNVAVASEPAYSAAVASPMAPPTAFSGRKVLALHDFSASTETEMSFRRGDVLEILRDSSWDGWLWARNKDLEGRVPKAYVSPF